MLQVDWKFQLSLVQQHPVIFSRLLAGACLIAGKVYHYWFSYVALVYVWMGYWCPFSINLPSWSAFFFFAWGAAEVSASIATSGKWWFAVDTKEKVRFMWPCFIFVTAQGMMIAPLVLVFSEWDWAKYIGVRLLRLLGGVVDVLHACLLIYKASTRRARFQLWERKYGTGV